MAQAKQKTLTAFEAAGVEIQQRIVNLDKAMLRLQNRREQLEQAYRFTQSAQDLLDEPEWEGEGC